MQSVANLDRHQPRSVPYYVRALAMGFPATLLGIQISGWIFFLPGVFAGHCDFRHLYTAAYMVRTGYMKQLYDYNLQRDFQNRLVSPAEIALPFNHLAYEALFFLPYSFGSFLAGYFAFLLTNIALLILLLRLMRPWTAGLKSIFPWLPAAMFLTFTPVAAALMQGQDSILLLVLFVLAYCVIKKKEATAGFLVGLGAAKIQMVLPVAAIFFLWKRWRFVAGFALAFSSVLFISTLMVGPDAILSYAHSLLTMNATQSASSDPKISPIMMPNLRGLVYALTAGWLPRLWVQAITVFLSLAILLLTAWFGRLRSCPEQFVMSVLFLIVVSYYIYTHDLVLLLLPIIDCLEGYVNDSAQKITHASIAVIAAAVFVSPGLFGLFPVPAFISSIPILIFLVFSMLRRVGGDPEHSFVPVSA